MKNFTNDFPGISVAGLFDRLRARADKNRHRGSGKTFPQLLQDQAGAGRYPGTSRPARQGRQEHEGRFQKGQRRLPDASGQANDPAISAEERDRRKQAAADKLKQLQTSKAAIEQYERQAQSTLSEQRQRMRDKILVEIKAAVSVKAKAGGYTWSLNPLRKPSTAPPWSSTAAAKMI